MTNIKRVLYKDISNGPGFRTSVFLEGCPGVIWNKKIKRYTHCPSCFNSEAWKFNTFNEFKFNKTLQEIMDSLHDDNISGISILGGEPLCKENQETTATIIRYTRTYYKRSKNIWVWTGFIYAKNPFNKNKIPKTKWTKYILKNIDTLIDGPFIKDKFNIDLQYRGSSNQRVLKLNAKRYI